jgi:hypothetical protein
MLPSALSRHHANLPIRHYFHDSNLYDAILRDIGTGCFEIEKCQWSFEVKFHFVFDSIKASEGRI